MIVPFVDLKAQYKTIASQVDEAMGRVVADSDFVLGSDVEIFEREFADFCEADYAIGLDSGTSALELTLRAYGIGEGSEVITVSHTFIATVASISYTGARPVLVDVDRVVDHQADHLYPAGPPWRRRSRHGFDSAAGSKAQAART